MTPRLLKHISFNRNLEQRLRVKMRQWQLATPPGILSRRLPPGLLTLRGVTTPRVQAAVLRIKLRELDNYIERRNKAAHFYDEAFKDISEISIPKRVDSSNHVFHQYTLKLNDEVNRDALVQFLASKEIPAMIYYPVPAHKQKMFADLNTECGNLEVTNWLTSRVFSLPMHTELTLEHQNYIVKTIKEYIKK